MAIDISAPARETRPSVMHELGRDNSFKPVSRAFMADTPVLPPKVSAPSEAYGGVGDDLGYLDTTKQLEVLANVDATAGSVDYNPDRASSAPYSPTEQPKIDAVIYAASGAGDKPYSGDRSALLH